MKLYEKYPQFQNRQYMMDLLVNNVYATMQLEQQGLHKKVIELVLLAVMKEKELEGKKLFFDKPL